MDLRHSYFAIPNPFCIVGRWFRPYRHRTTTMLRDNEMQVEWTGRADRALRERTGPLYVEMQLYFSCVVQKRILFHDSTEHETVAVTEELFITFRPVEAQSCDPETFAQNHPVKRELLTRSATMMKPRLLQIDYRDGTWAGSYYV